MIKGILWDNDGVLVNTEPLFYETNRQLFSEHNIELTQNNFLEWFLSDNCGAWHLLRERGYGCKKIDELSQQRTLRYGMALAQAESLVNNGIEDILSYLRPYVAMGVVTSAYAQHFYQMHRNLNLLPYFDFILTRENYIQTKPAPDGYLIGLGKLQLSASECIAIEDSPRGLHAANAAGLECIVLRNELTSRHIFPKAYRVVDTIEALFAEISKLLR